MHELNSCGILYLLQHVRLKTAETGKHFIIEFWQDPGNCGDTVIWSPRADTAANQLILEFSPTNISKKVEIAAVANTVALGDPPGCCRFQPKAGYPAETPRYQCTGIKAGLNFCPVLQVWIPETGKQETKSSPRAVIYFLRS